MKELVLAIQTTLRSGISYVRDNDIYIAKHENIIPASVRPPCIGIKDGPIKRIELAGGEMEYHMWVKIVLYVQLMQDDASIMGDISGNKGVLDVADDVHALLDESLLGITGMISAWSPSETESEWFGDDQVTMQRTILKYDYEKEEKRP